MSMMISFLQRIFQSPFSSTNEGNNQTQNDNNDERMEIDQDNSNLTTSSLSDSANNTNTSLDLQMSRIEWSVRRIREPSLMLSDNEIFAALKLLQHQFESDTRRGFYDPQSMNAKRTKKFAFRVAYPQRFLQIIHNGQMHWLTLSNFRSFNPTNQVQAYDSLPVESTYTNNRTIETCLQKILSSSDKSSGGSSSTSTTIECCIEPVQRQSDATMCGLFAIAYAVDLCLDIDPTTSVYDESQMRMHLYECLNDKFIFEFPKIKQRRACAVKTNRPPAIVFVDI